jgi:PGF-pre-PGF domain-containing protein
MKRNALTSIILFILLSTAVLAQTTVIEDFSTTGPEHIYTHQCTPTTSVLTVTNTGEISSDYFVTITGNAQNWAVLAPGQFRLHPGQTQNIIVNLAIPCTAKGTHTLDTTITTGYGYAKTLSQKIVVSKPNNIELTPITFSQTLLSCTQGTYIVDVKNTGGFTESYTVQAEQLSITPQRFALLPGDTQQVSLTFTHKDCNTPQKATHIPLTITADTGAQATTTLDLEVVATGIIGIQQKKIKTDFIESTTNINLNNKGEQHTYTFTTTGADWIRLPEQTLTLPPGKSQLSLLFIPTNTTEAGTYSLIITATNEQGLAFEQTISVTLKQLTLLDDLFGKYITLTISALVLLVIIILAILLFILLWHKHTQTPTYKKQQEKRKKEREERRKEQIRKQKERKAKRAKKKAEREKKRKQRLDIIKKRKQARKDRIQQRKDAKKAKKKQKKEDKQKRKEKQQQKKDEKYAKKIENAHEKKLKKEYRFITRKQIIPEDSNTWLHLLILFLVIAIITLIWDQRTFIEANKTYFWYGLTLLLFVATLLFVLHLHNKTIQKTFEYTHLHPQKKQENVTGWNQGITNIALTVKDVAANAQLRITRTQLPPHTIPNKPVYYYHAITTKQLDTKDIKELNVHFKVKKSWLAKKHIQPEDVRLAKYAEGWKNTPTTHLKEDKNYHYYQATTKKGMHAILGKQTLPKKEKKAKPKKIQKKTEKKITKKEPLAWKKLWYALLFFLIVIILAYTTFYIVSTALTTPNIPENITGIPPQVWGQDSQHVLSLNTFFEDPDGDILKFTNSDVDDIFISITDGLVTFTPQQGFTGKREVTFIATDSQGEEVMSNAVLLIITKKQVFIPELLQPYILHIIIGIVLLLAFILIMEFRKPLFGYLESQ